jgi:hypothetical protein
LRVWQLGVAVAAMLAAQQPVQNKTGPAVGSVVPQFEAPDQNGHVQTLQSVAGPKGTLLVFYRSADW